MSDPNFELMCNPDKFCYGEGGFGKKNKKERLPIGSISMHVCRILMVDSLEISTVNLDVKQQPVNYPPSTIG